MTFYCSFLCPLPLLAGMATHLYYVVSKWGSMTLLNLMQKYGILSTCPKLTVCSTYRAKPHQPIIASLQQLMLPRNISIAPTSAQWYCQPQSCPSSSLKSAYRCDTTNKAALRLHSRFSCAQSVSTLPSKPVQLSSLLLIHERDRLSCLPAAIYDLEMGNLPPTPESVL